MTTFEPLPPLTREIAAKALTDLAEVQREDQVRRETRWRYDENRRLREAEARSRFTGVPRQTLHELRRDPPAPIEWTIDRLAARGSITFSLGTFKAGKSTLIVNLLWAFADHVPFLCTYPVRRISGAIGYFDFEMGVTETFDRLNQIGCVNDQKIYVYDMVAEGFNLTDARDFEWLKSEINDTGMEVIVLDALRHIAKKKDGNSDSEIQTIFDQLERLRKECPALQDIFIPTHTAKSDARPGDDITALGSAAWDGGAQYRWGSYRTRDKNGWKFWFCLLPSRRTDPDAAIVREVTMDDRGVLSLGASGTVAAMGRREQARAERKKEIIAFVAVNQPTTKNKIFAAVGGGRHETMDLITSLHDTDLWINDQGGVWTYQGWFDHLSGQAPKL